MGDFTLHHKDKLSSNGLAAAQTSLSRQGSENPLTVLYDSYVINFFPKQLSPLCNYVDNDQGDFCGSSGTFIYKGQMGREALLTLLKDFTPDHYDPEFFSGLFTVILKKQGKLYLLTDPLGGNRVYHTTDMSFFSSSFLATASTVSRLTANPQAIYEYAFQETTYGTETVFKEVHCLDSLNIYEVTSDGLHPLAKNLNFTFQPTSQPTKALISDTVDLLRQTVQPISQIFGDKIRTALSGGYDSRLMLALLKDSGSTPQVYVYGPDNSPDVRVARTIAQAESFPLDHINKGHYPVPTPDQYQNILRDNFFALDGLPGESIFDFGANMDTRRKRAGNDHMIFNGGGGEIFRNFFYLPATTLYGGCFSIADLINCFYSRYSRIFCQDSFNDKNYREAMHDKIQTALGVSGDKLKRTEVEYAYPAFRLRYWTARDNNNNTRLGSYLTPFISYNMIRQALTVPLDFKNHGCFQAELIRAISPELASYTSDYGYAFDQPVPTKTKLKNLLTYMRPPILRRYSYAIQHKMRHRELPPTLDETMVSSTLDKGMPHMSDYFKIEQIKDPALLGRVYTVEYLFKYFGV